MIDKHHDKKDCKKQKEVIRNVNFRSICVSRKFQLDFTNIDLCIDPADIPESRCFSC